MESTSSSLEEPGPFGREVIRGQVWMTQEKGKGCSVTKATVVVCCATLDGQHSGVVVVLDDPTDHRDFPVTVTDLADLEDVRPQPRVEVTQVECFSHKSFLAKGMAPRGYSQLPTSSDTPSSMWPIILVKRDSVAIKFLVGSHEDQQRWCSWLKIFTRYPYSPVPHEPIFDPGNDLPRDKLSPAKYKADSVWYVYILPEEVGSRISVMGINILALNGQVSQGEVGQLTIFSATEQHTPRIIWDRSTTIRAGYLGNLTFVEIMEAAAGGPGLLWFYTGADEAVPLRQTLCRFIDEGDARDHRNVTSSMASISQL